MKVGLTKNQCLNYKSEISKKDEEINKLHEYIDGINNYFQQAQQIGNQIHNLIIPLVKPIQPLTLEKYIDLSTIRGHNKNYLKNLFRKYINYCKENLKLSDYRTIDGCPLDLNLDIYNPDNALKFFKERCKFERSSIKKIRDIFLLAFRKCTRNPSLEYSVPLGLDEGPNIKHYIKYNELVNFMEFLRKEKEMSVIFEILYKFGIRVSAIAKLKVKDLGEDGSIIFHEKNKKIILRKLKNNLFNKLRKIIKHNSLKTEDFLFYPSICPKDIDDRSKYFSNKQSKVIKESGCFNKKENETISAHMFRATHAINVFQKYGLERASKELNHSTVETTSKHYIKAEDRGLFKDEEQQLFLDNIDKIIFREPQNRIDIKPPTKKKSIKEVLNIPNKAQISNEVNNLELDDDDNSLFDSIFGKEENIDYSKNEAKGKNNFLNRKRKREINNFESETFFENEFVNDYNKFIEENNLNFSDIIISEPEQIKFSKSKIIIKF